MPSNGGDMMLNCTNAKQLSVLGPNMSCCRVIRWLKSHIPITVNTVAFAMIATIVAITIMLAIAVFPGIPAILAIVGIMAVAAIPAITAL
jgi:hypothetical protein